MPAAKPVVVHRLELSPPPPKKADVEEAPAAVVVAAAAGLNKDGLINQGGINQGGGMTLTLTATTAVGDPAPPPTFSSVGGLDDSSFMNPPT